MVELSHGSVEDLTAIFGNSSNKKESNYRQIERIRQRCVAIGIDIQFSEYTSTYSCPPNSKLILLEEAERQRRETFKPVYSQLRRFGPFRANKLVPPTNERELEEDS